LFFDSDEFKRKIIFEIVENKKTPLQVFYEYNIPIELIEKWQQEFSEKNNKKSDKLKKNEENIKLSNFYQNKGKSENNKISNQNSNTILKDENKKEDDNSIILMIGVATIVIVMIIYITIILYSEVFH